ncbi:glutaredoxin-C9-like [Magnolia sinica]|uniref:glutaredoxin-C9-like n=1 Tax=Magnolia sinica TaxID=86752 RepID=UPI002659DFFF|nr:glutaredoxin-C9-like [Magnolia sinica]
MQFLEDSSRGLSMVMDGGDRDLPVDPATPYERLRKLASGNAVVVFSLSGCCMCHVIKRLLIGLGVGPTIYELDEEKGGREIQAVLYQVMGNGQQSMPAVFVGGKLVGGLENVMSSHINGTFVPLLKEAGALWL